jgi:hypothetical protein
LQYSRILKYNTLTNMIGKIRSKRFNEFLKSGNTFQVYSGNSLLFTSREEKLIPVIEYMDSFIPYKKGVVVYDRIVGNAAALLFWTIKCRLVLSELGSKNAVRTLKSAGIKYHFNEVVDYILNESGQDMCPMEKLSLGKTPEDFLKALRNRLGSEK